NHKLVEEGLPKLNLVIATSDAFFERPKNRVRAQRFFLALIDAPALHVFENLTSLAAPDSIFAIQGCRPHAWMRNENAEGRDCVPRSRCEFSGYLRRHFFRKNQAGVPFGTFQRVSG